MSSITQEKDLTEVPEGYGLLSIADPTGDTRLMWDPRNKDEVETAKAAFKKAQDKGMLAYLVGEDGEQGEVIREFPKKAGKLIMTRQLVGG